MLSSTTNLRTLAATGPAVAPIGLGAMGMSDLCYPAFAIAEHDSERSAG